MSSYSWVQRLAQENKDTNGLAVMSFPWWVGDPFIHHKQVPLWTWGHFLPGIRYSAAFLNHWIGNSRDSCELPQLHAVKPDLWDPATSFWADSGMPENVTFLGDAGWIGVLTKVTIYPTCANLHWKIVVLAAPIQGLSGYRVASYPVTCKQLKKTNSGCPG